MSLLPPTPPAGWSSVTVGDLAQYINGFAFKPEDWGQEGLPIIRIQNLTDPTKTLNYTIREVPEKYIVHPGELLVSWSATLDAFIWTGPMALLNQHIFRVVPDCDRVDPSFLYYLLRCVIRDLAEGEHLHGSTMKHINRGPFLAHPVSVPSILEQRRIVARIEEMAERIQRATGALAPTSSLSASLERSILVSAFQGELTADWRQTHPMETGLSLLNEVFAYFSLQATRPSGRRRPVVPQKDLLAGGPIENLPASWAWTTLRSVTEIRGGIQKGKTRSGDEQLVDVPYLRVANVQRGYLDLSEVTTLPATADEIAELRLQVGDVLFNEGGDRDKLGRGWVWQGEIETCIHQNHVFRARPAPGLVHPKLLSWYANTFGQDFFFQSGKQTTGLASISMSVLGSLPVPLMPVAEQTLLVQRIEERLGRVRGLRVQTATLSSAFDRIERSILSAAFSGTSNSLS